MILVARNGRSVVVGIIINVSITIVEAVEETTTVVVMTVGGRSNNDGAHNTATHGGNEGGNRGGINGGSIINASGQQMKLPATLSKQYCGHFLDTELRCNFGQ